MAAHQRILRVRDQLAAMLATVDRMIAHPIEDIRPSLLDFDE